MVVKYKKLHEHAVVPRHTTDFAAGADLCARHAVVIGPGEVRLIPTGLAVELPRGTFLDIRQRSGLSVKHPNYLANAAGVIDEDYRGELKIPVANHSDQIWIIEPGERIAQGILLSCHHQVWNQTDHLAESGRGTGGYGSTGKV